MRHLFLFICLTHFYTLFRPANKKELFNLRHASARNVIERAFSVLKRRFWILQLAPEYSFDVQARIPAALCAMHNFIVRFDPLDDEPMHGNTPIDHDHDDHHSDNVDFPEMGPETDASIKRNQIAEGMWQSYLSYCAAEADGDSHTY